VDTEGQNRLGLADFVGAGAWDGCDNLDPFGHLGRGLPTGGRALWRQMFYWKQGRICVAKRPRLGGMSGAVVPSSSALA